MVMLALLDYYGKSINQKKEMNIILSKDFIYQVPDSSFVHDKIGTLTLRDTVLSSELISFYSDNYYPGYILGNAKLFKWMFKNNGGVVTVLADKSKVIAHQGHVPIVFTDGKNDFRGFISASTMVDKNYRRMGLMSVLRSNVQNRYEMAASIGGSKLGIALYSSMGYRHFGNMHRLIAVHNPALCKNVSQGGEIIKTFNLVLGKNEKIKTIENFKNHADSIDDLRNSVFKPETYFSVKRDAEFLEWRYSEHPIFHYKRYGLWEDNILKALIVFRVEEVSDVDARVIRIVELIGEPRYLEEIIKGTIHTEEISEHIAWIDWFSPNILLSEVVKKCGFLYENEIETKFPIFCSPIDYEKQSYPVMFWSKDEIMYEHLPLFETWYLTKGDGDADRPNVAEGYTREN